MKEHKRRGQRKLKINRQNIVGLPRRSKEPIDYGVTKKQFFGILEKVSKPIKKVEPESETEKAQT